MSALDQQVGGTHYNKLKIQPVEFIAANGWDYPAGSAFKYITRYKDKNGRQDLEKAIHFLELRIQVYSAEGFDCLHNSLIDWLSVTTFHREPGCSVVDYILANSYTVTDHRYKALMLLEELVVGMPSLVKDRTSALIDYLKFVIAIEYPETPIDN